jgi:hypothetical protein
MANRARPALRVYKVSGNTKDRVEAATLHEALETVPCVVLPPEGGGEALLDARDTFLLIARGQKQALVWCQRQPVRQDEQEMWAVECPARGDDTNYACFLTSASKSHYGRAFVRSMLTDWMEHGSRSVEEWEALDEEVSARLEAWADAEAEARECIVCGCRGILERCDQCGRPVCATHMEHKRYVRYDPGYVGGMLGMPLTDFCPECLIEVDKRAAPWLAPKSVAQGRARTLWLLAFVILTPPALPCILILKCAGIVAMVVPLPFLYLAVMLAALPLHVVVFPWRWAGLKLGWTWTDVYPRRQDWLEGW